MTREEATSIINVIVHMLEPQYDNDRVEEAVDMAIKALEQKTKADIALERYKDLQDYFSDEETAKSILENQTEFKAWLERLRWNTQKVDELARKLEALEQEPKTDVLDKIRAEIEQKIEQERYARSVFRSEEKDDIKAEQCTGSIFAYNNVIRLIDKYKAEQGGE